MATSEPLGQRVRRLREKAGLTQDQLAEEVGLSRPAMNKIETGFTPKPHRSTLQKIAEVLVVTENYLRTGSDKVFAPLEAPATKAPPVTQAPTMQVVDESGELRAVKEERDHLRKLVDRLTNALLARSNPSSATGTDGSFNSGNLSLAASEEPADTTQFMYVQLVGPEPVRPHVIEGLRRYDLVDALLEELEAEDSDEVTHLRVA